MCRLRNDMNSLKDAAPLFSPPRDYRNSYRSISLGRNILRIRQIGELP